MFPKSLSIVVKFNVYKRLGSISKVVDERFAPALADHNWFSLLPPVQCTVYILAARNS